jgi:PTS system mannitol-specific IIA component
MSEIVTKDLIIASGSATTRDEAIREAGNLLLKADAVTPAYVEAMQEREQSISTYMGSYLAIPHGTNASKEAIRHSAVSLVRYESPIDWDGHQVRIVVGIAGVDNEHLAILSKIAIIFSDEAEARRCWMRAPSRSCTTCWETSTRTEASLNVARKRSARFTGTLLVDTGQNLVFAHCRVATWLSDPSARVSGKRNVSPPSRSLPAGRLLETCHRRPVGT